MTSAPPPVRILQATGLPRHLSNFVFCQYRFWGQEQPLYITPELELQGPPGAKDPHCTVVFDSTEVGQGGSGVKG